MTFPSVSPPTVPPALTPPAALLADGLGLRAQAEADLPFIHDLYTALRWEELARAGWSDEQRAAFCLMQSQLQQRHYADHYVGGEFAIIERHGEPIGRLYLFRSPSEMRIADIALTAPWRGRGIGAALLEQAQREAAAAGQRVVIHVEKENPAQRLYARLGFAVTDDVGAYWRMEWHP